jgi:hypothetical protein
VILISVHFASQGSWPLLLLATLGLAALGLWSYRFRLPPLPAPLRAGLTALRIGVLASLLWLLGQPVLQRSRAGAQPRVVALVDRSASMELPARGGGTRSQVAQGAVEELRRTLRGRAQVTVMGFGDRLQPDLARPDSAPPASATALGEALAELGRRPESQDLGSVVVVSDGVVNAGRDPQAAAATLGVPVHGLLVSSPSSPDRAVLEVESGVTARVGEPTPLRIHLVSGEPRGERIRVRVLEAGREVARADAVSPGPGAESVVAVTVTPAAPGLGLFTAQLDSLPGELTASNNARSAALEVLPGRLGVAILTGGLNWDLTFLRRALLGDSSLAVRGWSRGRGGWSPLDRGLPAEPVATELRRQSVIVLDGVGGGQLEPALHSAVLEAVRGGAGLLLLGGAAPPGLARYREGAWGDQLVPAPAGGGLRTAAPVPEPGAVELLAWDEDAARGERAWRAAAPLSDVIDLDPSAGDRVLLRALGDGPALLLSRRVGRGQVLMMNGSGFWRWSMSAGDATSAERSTRLWRRVARWLAEPVQAEPLRVRPERLLTPRGETPRLTARLQDAAFRPVSGARVQAELSRPGGRALQVTLEPRTPGSYVAALPALPPGRYRVDARATRQGAEVGRTQTDFAVDRWSLEEARAHSDSLGLARLVQSTGGRLGRAEEVAAWARGLDARAAAAGRLESVRLWESPWVFAAVIAALGVEWMTRRKRGLP